jgi:hypothetical protein
VYLSHRDAAQFFRRAVDAPSANYLQLFVSSRNGGASAFDLAAAKEAIGYEPIDTFPEGTSFEDWPEFASPRLQTGPR